MIIESVREIREWHRINRDVCDHAWRMVDFLLGEIDGSGPTRSMDEIEDAIMALEDAKGAIDDALSDLGPSKIKRRLRRAA